MEELSHWDFAEHFSGYDAAALVLGIEPWESSTEQLRVGVVLERMKSDYTRVLHRLIDEEIAFVGSSTANKQELPQIELMSVEMESLHHDAWLHGADGPLSEWLFSAAKIEFDRQRFHRHSILNWLKAIGLKSIYRFDLQTPPVSEPKSKVAEFDPSDLPPELDAANLAYRAFQNGYGDQSTTPRNRLISFLESNFPDFKPEQIQRIATVANPDKTTGRKKLDKE